MPCLLAVRPLAPERISATGQQRFTEHDRNIGLQMASLLSSAIENARLFEENLRGLAEAEDQAWRLALLNEMGQQMSLAGSTDEILRAVTDFTPQIIPADRVSVALLVKGNGSEAADRLEVFALQGPAGVMPVGKQTAPEGNAGRADGPRERGLSGWPTSGRATRWMPSNWPDRACGPAMTAPLTIGDAGIGTLNVGSEQPGIL